jgi:hypothetical protein
MLFDGDGNRMTPSHAVKHGRGPHSHHPPAKAAADYFRTSPLWAA